ncbi:RNA 2',3'-cyclic phosphodiesterase [Streptomyces sp. NPDC051132]|uniref:RNA 2',3'-cyclic phosphodiesterase n=1 Tax=unclassified Streptomyces TaxID=2593676 RepID=UPI00343B526B
MRLFAAVLPPEDIADEFAAEVDRLRRLPGADRLRWTERSGWHFTLAFYGEVAEDVVPALSDRLARAARRAAPFTLAIAGGGRFGQGRALWAGARGDVEELSLLAGRAQAAARKAGVPTDEHRPYKAHLTVARGRGPVDVRPQVELLGAYAGRSWQVTEMTLVRSRLPASGVPGEQPRYEVVGRWALGAGG